MIDCYVGNPAKRRTVSSTASNSFTSTSAAPNKLPSLADALSGPSSSSSQSYTRPHPVNRTWPSIAATETDLTTPELCSDNEVEKEADSSIDDRLPSTPPVISGTRLSQKGGGAKRRVDADVEMDPPSRQQRQSDPFAKRAPTSPMPLDTPRKPRPPARSLGRSTPKPKTRRDNCSEDDDDPLSLSFSSPDVVPISAPRATGRSRLPAKTRRVSPGRERDARAASVSARSRSNHSDRRRLTLDDELRDARARSLLREDEEDPDLDSGTLVGVGTRGKERGFLAHGGAGGLPVFMGKGYVEGVEESDNEDGDDDDDDYVPERQSRGGRSIPAVTKRKSRR